MGLADTLYGPLSSAAGAPATSSNQPPEVSLANNATTAGDNSVAKATGPHAHPTVFIVALVAIVVLVLHFVVHRASLSATLDLGS